MSNRRSLLEKASWIAGIISGVMAILGTYAFIAPSNGNSETRISQKAGDNSFQIGNVTGDVSISPKSGLKEQAVPNIDKTLGAGKSSNKETINSPQELKDTKENKEDLK